MHSQSLNSFAANKVAHSAVKRKTGGDVVMGGNKKRWIKVKQGSQQTDGNDSASDSDLQSSDSQDDPDELR